MTPQKFISTINKEGGISRSNKFKVTIVVPALFSIAGTSIDILNRIVDRKNTPFSFKDGLDIAGQELFDLRYYGFFGINPFTYGSTLEVLCDSAVLPGSNFQTVERRTYGPPRKIPYDQVFEDVSFSFIGTANMKQRYFFDAWQYSIKDPITNNYNYPDEYTTTVFIRQYDVAGKFKYGVRLLNAWPINVQATNLSYGEEGIVRSSVTLSYKNWFNLKAYDTYANDIGDLATQIAEGSDFE
jgi:hypothetical protein